MSTSDTPTQLEDQLPTAQLDRTDIQQVIKECLQICSKDGLAMKRMENVENCFW